MRIMGFFSRLFRSSRKEEIPAQLQEHRVETELDREISALYAILVDVIGSDRLIIQAGKMDALRYMRSENPGERLLALRRILEENPTLGPAPKENEIPTEMGKISELLADMMARRNIEDRIEKRISEKMEKEHQDYVKDIRLQVLKEEKPDALVPAVKRLLSENEGLARRNAALQKEILLSKLRAEGADKTRVAIFVDGFDKLPIRDALNEFLDENE